VRPRAPHLAGRIIVAAAALLLALPRPVIAAAQGGASGPRFVEVGAEVGARRVHHTHTFSGPYADALGMFTSGGAAVAVGDYDGDGDDDLFVTNSERGSTSHLLRNELVESGELAFTDVTGGAGVGGGNEGNAIVSDALWLDADDDGREDLLVVRFGTPLLYRNLGGGRFADVTAGSGLDRFANSIAAIAFDADADGDVDLLLGHYFRAVDLVALPERRVLPDNLDDAHNGGGVTFWRNETPPGSAAIRFADRTAEAGFAHHAGWTLDLGHGDLDDDGDQDVYLAGDYGTDRLFMNRGDGTFDDVTERTLGFDTRKGMNADFGDWNRDGRLDVYVTNITDEYMRECNFLWTNEGEGRFIDLARETGSCDTGWGWAAKFGDFDNDAWQDLFVVNGLRSAGEDNYIPVLLEMILRPGVDYSDVASWPPIGGKSWSGYQRSKLLHNRGGELFADVAAAAGVDDPGDGRGIGMADFDADGRLDLYVTNADQASLLYRNTTPDAGHWVAARLVGTRSNRSAIGARLTITAGGVTQVREVDGGNGYASQSSRRLHFGLGAAERVDAAVVRWPSGLVERFALAVDQVATLREGDGEAVPAPGAIDATPAGRPKSTAEPAAAPPLTGAELEERLWHHRNLGKAFYENPTTQYEAVGELEKVVALVPGSARDRLNLALALLRAGRVPDGVAELQRVQAADPTLPHTWFNLGIAAKRDARNADAIAQLERFVALVPGEPIASFNLGVLYKLEGDDVRSLAAFETAARSGPELAGPHFQLYNAYRAAGRQDEAARELAAFRAARAAQEGAAIPEDLEWNRWAELLDEPTPVAPEPPPAALQWRDSELARGLDPATAGLALLDADGDGGTDLLAWSAAGIALHRLGVAVETGAAEAASEDGPSSQPGAPAPADASGAATTATGTASGLEVVSDVIDVAVGDFDDDGLADLAVVRTGGPQLWRNGGRGHFELFATAPATGAGSPAAAGEGLVVLPSGSFRRALWLDFDHDYDLDLVLLGDSAAVLRNPGGGLREGWVDRTANIPFVAGEALAADSLHIVADTQGVDLVVAYRDRPGVAYRDRLGGRFTAEPLAELPAGTRQLLADDADADGWVDLVADGVVLRNRGGDGWEPAPARPAQVPPGEPAPAGPEQAPPMQVPAQVLPAQVPPQVPGTFPAPPPGSVRVLADLGGTGRRALVAPPFPAAAAVAADFDGDGRVDLAAVGTDGVLRLHGNATPGAAPPAVVVRLEGVKNRQLPSGAEVEVKSGSLYQKQVYRGVPLHFALGGRTTVDAVRITWPNGLIQNEARQEPGSHFYREAPRLSGSCPMVFAWDGSRFAFVTDVLGVAPLGAAAGEGEYFPVDHDEVVQIPSGGLVAADGRYELRITEELREVAFLDLVRLVAVDHPPAVEVFVNDQFQAPPFPEHRLVPVGERFAPIAARDDAGRDVLARVLARDRTYPDGFERHADGTAEPHHLDLDFGSAAPDGKVVLVLDGWVDWADGSTFLGLAQRPGGGLAMPRLLVRDEAGAWVTAIPELGIPAGKPKTIVVDLHGKWRSASRQVRIESTLCLYWDEVFLARPADGAPLVRTELAPVVADLRFRGFARPVIHPQRLQPESFDYHTWSPTSMWNPTPGLYTRYGDVRPLLERVDDQLLVMGSGDEVRLSFDAAALPPLPAGWRRDFLVAVDGWAKDGDANTAFSQSVEPLPFHGMSRYPYPAGEAYPDTPELRRYRETWNTRPALRLLRPLRPESPEALEAAAEAER
jgi:tetratricopeptide (TPR) repeat protein